jgi:hypothetical protein
MTRENRPFIIDIEASGFGGTSYPIEIGVALGGGKKYCTLISPKSYWTHWDENAEKLHNISRDDLVTHGKPVEEVADTLNKLLRGMTLYSDCWVVDKPWLTTLFYAACRPMHFDVSPLELILTEGQMERWHKTRDDVTLQMKLVRHRASHDALIIQETFRQTLLEPVISNDRP